LDISFGLNGKKTFYANPNSTTLTGDLELQADAKIVVTSTTAVSSITGLDYCISRFLSNGTIDSTFGLNGHTITDIDGGNDFSYRTKIQNDGRILIAGNADNDGAAAITLVRYIYKISIGTKDFSLKKNHMIIYPNPVSSHATLEYTLNDNENIRLELLDIKGTLIETIITSEMKSKGTHSKRVSLENLKTGNYFLVMRTSIGKAVIKIQKN